MRYRISIPLHTVLTNQSYFRITTAHNVSMEEAYYGASSEDVDWDWVKECMQPVLMCQFWPRAGSHYVYLEEDQLVVSCIGARLKMFVEWLDGHGFYYQLEEEKSYEIST